MRGTLILLVAAVASVHAFPSYLTSRQDGSDDDGGDDNQGVLIVPPPVSNDTGLKAIPDAEHFFQAPGPNDQRGPCPGLNTMANHGYIPRNGIASFEDIVNGAREAFNMEHDLASALAAFGMLARGNAFIDRVSIGGQSPLIPPLPGNLDGPAVLGLATHGRFEGDVSMTRQDAAVGDNRNFQVDLYDSLLLTVGQFGSDSPITGNRSIVTLQVMQEFKFQRFVVDQVHNPELQYHIGRFLLSYGEAAFTLNFFANGTTQELSVPTMGSFFRNQTFPENWHRRSSPGSLDLIGTDATEILAAHPIVPGANDANGNFVADTLPASGTLCALYQNLGSDNLPVSLNNATGLLKTNVDTLLDAIFKPFSSGCTQLLPAGPVGV